MVGTVNEIVHVFFFFLIYETNLARFTINKYFVHIPGAVSVPFMGKVIIPTNLEQF